MTWLQDNMVAVIAVAVVAIAILWWLFARRKSLDTAPPRVEPAKPAKPLEPKRPEIVAAEPAFKKAPPAWPAPSPVAEPVATPPPASPAAPVAAPQAEIPEEPTVAPEPAATPVAQPEPPAAPASAPAAMPEEPTVPPPAAPGPAATGDNLQLLKGVGPKMVALLNGLGITRFQQIADWTDADVAAIDPQLGAFQGRIARDAIVDQAGYLARGDKAGFEAKYGALGGEL